MVSVEAVGSAAFEHGRSLAGNYAGSFRATRDVVRSGVQLGPEMRERYSVTHACRQLIFERGDTNSFGREGGRG